MTRKAKRPTAAQPRIWYTLINKDSGAYDGKLYVFWTLANFERVCKSKPNEWRIARVRISEVRRKP